MNHHRFTEAQIQAPIQAERQHDVGVDISPKPHVTNHKLDHRPELKDETLAHPPPETSSPNFQIPH